MERLEFGKNSEQEMNSEKHQAMQKVAKLVKELMGERSIRQTSSDTGVAASYISGILKCKYLPSAETLKKLTALQANPQNGVILEDLMIAAGYQEDYIYMNKEVDKKVDENIEKYTNENADKDVVDEDKDKMRELLYKERRKERIKFESMSTGIIYNALAEKNIRYYNEGGNSCETIGVRGYRPDLTIAVPKQPILEWWFEFKIFNFRDTIEVNRHRANIQMGVKTVLSHFMFVTPNLQRKISLVINDKEAFEYILGYKNKLAYRGDLSVILIDLDSFSVVQEEYLAHYNDDDNTDTEFYIK